MKTKFAILILMMAGTFSCETFRPAPYVNYLDYLKDKAIIAIHIQGDTKYIFTSRYCDTCKIAPEMSYIPTIQEWTVIEDTVYYNVTPDDFVGLPVEDNKGNLYIAKGTTIFKLNNSGVYDQLFNTGSFDFTSFAFDKADNIWFFSDEHGIAFWNKTDLTVYNTQNSELPTDRIHGLAVDSSGIVWAALDFEGLLKIDGETWTVIPNSEIPGLTDQSYLRGPQIVTQNSIWFEVFRPDTTSNIVRLENSNWIYEYPLESGYFHVVQDSRGTIWSVANIIVNGELDYASLKYYDNGSWIDFDVSDIHDYIYPVNADDEKVYIGTLNGLVEKEW